jgi:hypothetical protein
LSIVATKFAGSMVGEYDPCSAHSGGFELAAVVVEEPSFDDPHPAPSIATIAAATIEPLGDGHEPRSHRATLGSVLLIQNRVFHDIGVSNNQDNEQVLTLT